MSLLTVSDLTVQYSRDGRVVRAVEGVSFAVEEGETLALVGESGCGKTTAALAVLRLLPTAARVEAKSITLDGRELTGLSESALRGVRGKDIGMIFQEPAAALNPLLCVGEQVAEGVRAHERVGRREAWERAVDALAEAGVPDPRRRAAEYPHQLSGGLKQRAMIAAALVCRPRLLIADEPTTALDVSLQAQILDLLLKLREERRLAILLITHDLGVVAELAQRVVVLYAGQVVEQAEVKDLFVRPRHPYTGALLAAVPGLGRTEGGRRLAALEGTVPDLTRPPAGCRFAPRCRSVQEACAAPQELRSVGRGLARCGRAEDVT